MYLPDVIKSKFLKKICNYPYLHFVIINVFTNVTKIHQLVYSSNDLLTINEISTSIKGHNSVENERKILLNHPNPHLLSINAYTKFDRNAQIKSPDI